MLTSFVLFRHVIYGLHCYKQAMKFKLQVFYHILSYKSAAASGFKYGVYNFSLLFIVCISFRCHTGVQTAAEN